MSDDNTDNTENNSLFSNLVNKVKYKAHTAAYDPQANEFAKQQAAKKKAEKEPEQPPSPDNTTDTQTDDPNQVNGTRFLNKLWTQTVDALKKGFIPFVALMLAMIVANEMIVYAVPIRIIFFIFVMYLCVHRSLYAYVLGIFYILKGGYSYYLNNMTDGPKRNLMPTIYALLPITTYQSSSSLGSFFLYPFTYPKTEVAAVELPKIMANYWDELRASFKYYDTIKTLPIFVDDIEKIKNGLKNLHYKTGTIIDFKNNTAKANESKPANGEEVTANNKNKPANGEEAAANEKNSQEGKEDVSTKEEK